MSLNLSELLKSAKDAGIISKKELYLESDIPDDIEEFYHELGDPFIDSKTNENIHELAPYQKRTIQNHLNHQKLLVIKSQKIGLSSLGIVIALWHALRDCQGFEIIVLAQSKEKAIQHGRDMRKFLSDSKYKDYLITKPSEIRGLLRDEVTKMTEIYIQNRKDPQRPTQIHILPPSATQIASLKRVKFAWCSDITIIKDVADRQNLYFLAMMSRLILTEGPVFIECPAVGHLGPIWQIDDDFQKKMKAGEEIGEYDFYVDRIKVQEAVDAGLMTPEAVQALRTQHGPMFGALFEGDWFAGDQAWFNRNQFEPNELMNYYVEDNHEPLTIPLTELNLLNTVKPLQNSVSTDSSTTVNTTKSIENNTNNTMDTNKDIDEPTIPSMSEYST